MRAFGLTDIGKVRKENQDSFAIQMMEKEQICVVCDGMGGARAGNVASELAVEAFVSHILMRKAGKYNISDGSLVAEATNYANIKVYDRAVTDPDCEGMGTTLVGGIFEENRAHIAHVGDSRAYMISRDVIWQITTDHSYVEELVAQGKISRQEAKTHPRRNFITRALGIGRDTQCDVYELETQAGDIILLCSDGMTNMLSDEEMREIVLDKKNPSDICRELMNMALRREATDNITVVIFEF